MSLDDPDFILGPLKISIDGYQFPDATDYWGANWLLIIAEIDIPGQAWVRATGPFIMNAELARFRDEMEMIYDQLDGQAGLWTIEPELRIALESKNNGLITAEIDITPDNMTQEHKFFVDLDQSHLPLAISQLNTILERFPVRGQSE